MIVYVESNFVLEIARNQEQAAEADEILGLAEQGRVELAFPSIAVCEPFSTWGYRRTDFARIRSEVERAVRLLLPAGVTFEIVLDAGYVAQILTATSARLDETILRMLQTGTAIPVSSDVFQRSLDYRGLGLSKPQDAVVFASVVKDLEARNPREAKCFVSKDAKDLDQEDLKQLLRRHQCEFKPNFAAGLAWLRAHLSG